MYLTFQEYVERGGKVDYSAFHTLERRAEGYINSQACGMAGERIGKLTELPEAIKDCTFDLIECLNASQHAIASESQSVGGVSESKSYLQKDYKDEMNDILLNAFDESNLKKILYKGLDD